MSSLTKPSMEGVSTKGSAAVLAIAALEVINGVLFTESWGFELASPSAVFTSSVTVLVTAAVVWFTAERAKVDEPVISPIPPLPEVTFTGTDGYSPE